MNYITLKPYCTLNRCQTWFLINHELHHSQTKWLLPLELELFLINHELHHSQTKDWAFIRSHLFLINHELHHSQTPINLIE